MTTTQEIKHKIEEVLTNQKRDTIKFIIFPFGEIGQLVKQILESVYDITPVYCIDNHLCQYNSNLKPSTFLKEIDLSDYQIFLATTTLNVHEAIRLELLHYAKESNIIELSCQIEKKRKCQNNIHRIEEENNTTIVGKYSYGPLTNNLHVKQVGAFSSFSQGCDVVFNHPTTYISTHPFIYYGKENNPDSFYEPYDSYYEESWYFEGVKPKRGADKTHRITIGNDVWFGRNVLVTNSAHIGNGVIAAAGAIITKDVPDYAIVAGIPARIIRYRYTPEQIDALNRIQWWNWSDDEIRERYDDFYIDIETFIQKYDT